MFFIDRIHNPVTEFVGDNHNHNLLLGLECDAMIFLKCLFTAPSGSSDGATAGAKTSGSIKYRFCIALVDADKNQAVFIF